MRLFEQGVQLSNACKQELEKAEGRIQVLVETSSGAMQVAEMELDDEALEEDEDIDDADTEA